jgi:hypothetical protein
MNKALSLIIGLFLSISCYSANISITNQADWNGLVSSPIMATDTVTIEAGATVVNMMALDILGTIINHGDFTMNGPAGVAVNMMGSIVNYGVFTVGTVGLSIVDGTFINVGTLNVSGAAIVIQPSGILYNTGTINNNIDILNLNIFSNCGTIGGIGSLNGNLIGSTVPIDTPCDDMDPDTEDDVIVDTNCTCQGEMIRPIPTLSQWGLIIIMISFLIIGVVAIRRKYLATH